MKSAKAHGKAEDLGREPHLGHEAAAENVQAWEEIEAGRYMPRRIRGSDRGRTLG